MKLALALVVSIGTLVQATPAAADISRLPFYGLNCEGEGHTIFVYPNLARPNSITVDLSKLEASGDLLLVDDNSYDLSESDESKLVFKDEASGVAIVLKGFQSESVHNGEINYSNELLNTQTVLKNCDVN